MIIWIIEMRSFGFCFVVLLVWFSFVSPLLCELIIRVFCHCLLGTVEGRARIESRLHFASNFHFSHLISFNMSDKKPERHGTEDYWMSDKLSREANDTNWLWRTVRKYHLLDLRK